MRFADDMNRSRQTETSVGTPRIDFIGIGTNKGGSTWVSSFLDQHPDICLSEPKEIGYFNRTDFRKVPEKGDQFGFNECSQKSLDWYGRHFDHCSCESVRGEFTPIYFYDHQAAKRIKDSFPCVKLILTLRNPIDRAYSNFCSHRYYRRIHRLTFEEALKALPFYEAHGHYLRYLEVYLKYFDSDQLKIILFDDIVASPETVVEEVFRFLNVDPDKPVDLSVVDANRAKRSRFVSFEPLLNAFSNWMVDNNQVRLLHFLRKRRAKALLINLTTSRFSYPNMRPETRAWLQARYLASNQQLAQRINRDLGGWR